MFEPTNDEHYMMKSILDAAGLPGLRSIEDALVAALYSGDPTLIYGISGSYKTRAVFTLRTLLNEGLSAYNEKGVGLSVVTAQDLRVGAVPEEDDLQPNGHVTVYEHLELSQADMQGEVVARLDDAQYTRYETCDPDDMLPMYWDVMTVTRGKAGGQSKGDSDKLIVYPSVALAASWFIETPCVSDMGQSTREQFFRSRRQGSWRTKRTKDEHYEDAGVALLSLLNATHALLPDITSKYAASVEDYLLTIAEHALADDRATRLYLDLDLLAQTRIDRIISNALILHAVRKARGTSHFARDVMDAMHFSMPMHLFGHHQQRFLLDEYQNRVAVPISLRESSESELLLCKLSNALSVEGGRSEEGTGELGSALMALLRMGDDDLQQALTAFLVAHLLKDRPEFDSLADTQTAYGDVVRCVHKWAASGRVVFEAGPGGFDKSAIKRLTWIINGWEHSYRLEGESPAETPESGLVYVPPFVRRLCLYVSIASLMRLMKGDSNEEPWMPFEHEVDLSQPVEALEQLTEKAERHALALLEVLAPLLERASDAPPSPPAVAKIEPAKYTVASSRDF